MGKPFLHCHRRFKNGKDHRYWSIAEKVRTHRGWVQRHILYLGEINDSQRQSWTKVIDVFDPVRQHTAELALYPDSRPIPDCGFPKRGSRSIKRPSALSCARRSCGKCAGAKDATCYAAISVPRIRRHSGSSTCN